MNRKTLINLLALAVLLIIAVTLTNMSKQRRGDVRQLLAPGLEEQLNELTSMRLVGAANQPIATLTQTENTWVVAEKSGYRADIGRIRSNLIALAQAKIVEQKTANPEFFERLGVEDITAETAGGVLIELDSLTEPVRIIVGDTGVGGGDYAYAREAGGTQSWLVSGAFDLATDTLDWLDRDILDIPTARIRAVTITHPNGEVLSIHKTAAKDLNFTVQGIPEGRELSYASIADAVAGVLTGLRLEDVQTSMGLNSAGVTPTKILFETFDGLLIELTTYSLADGDWIQVAARVGELPAAPASADTGDTPDQADTDALAIGDEVELLNARLDGWAYTITSYKSEQLLKRIDDLLAPRDDDLLLPEKTE